MNPELLKRARAKGTDREYLAWLRLWPSALSGEYDAIIDGIGHSTVAHNRAVKDGAGTAIKPEYSAIPLLREEHDLTHQKGQSIFCPQEWYEKKKISYLVKWINGVQPPVVQDNETQKKEFIIEYPGQIFAIFLLAKKHFIKGGRPLKITVQKKFKNRSRQQCRAQWGLVYRACFDFYKKNPGKMARDFIKAMRFQITEDCMHSMFKVLYNGGKSTRGLNTVEHNLYLEKIREDMEQKYGLSIPLPVNPNEIAMLNDL